MTRRRIDFSGVLAEQRATGFVYEYTHPSIHGKPPIRWNFRDLAPEGLAREFARRIGPIAPDLFRDMASSTFEGYRGIYRALGRQLLLDPTRKFESLRDLEPEDIDALDQPGQFTRYRCLQTLFRGIFRDDPFSLTEATAARIFLKSRFKGHKPREPISDAIRTQIIAISDRKIREIRDRIQAGREYFNMSGDASLLSTERRVELKVALGEELSPHEKRVWRSRSTKISVYDLKEKLMLSIKDCIVFFLAIAARENIPTECIKYLRRDCLTSPYGNHCNLSYQKNRDRVSPRKFEQISDGGSSTTGGIIRILKDLTSLTYKLLEYEVNEDADFLLISFSLTGDKKIGLSSLSTNNLNREVLTWGIVEDDGNLLTHFQSSRLRKTAKREEYRAARGVLSVFARGHSRAVASDHYARIEELEELHRSAIEAAQADVMNSAMWPLVLPPSQEAQLTTKNDAYLDPIFNKLSPKILSENDTILGVCLDFWNSPMNENQKGECTAGFMACLHCRNAVFHLRKLPSLLSFYAYAQNKLSIMSVEEWLRTYGPHWARIRYQILPAFSKQDVEKALAAATISEGEFRLLEGVA